MTKSVKGGRRKGSGRPAKPAGTKKVQWWVYLTEKELEDFKAVGGTSKQVVNLVRTYTIARGKTDSLLAQSPTALKLMAYLEATNAPEELRNELGSLIVQRASDEVKLLDEVVETIDGTYVV